MGRLALAVFAVLITVALAGCGGSKVYSQAPSKTCLMQRGVKLGGQLDFVANTATGGAFRADLPDGNFAKVAFGQNVNSGQDIESAYERFALPNVRAGLASVLHRYKNAVVLWHATPSDSDLALIVGCLR